MLASKMRILTSHAGSLPRPPALTQLYAARSRGQSVDHAEIARMGAAAVASIVEQQTALGLDIISN